MTGVVRCGCGVRAHDRRPLLRDLRQDEQGSATSSPGLGSPRPPLHRDWAHPSHHCTGTWSHPFHICTGPALTRATSAPGLGSQPPHLHWDCAHPCHICTGTALTRATSAPGLGSQPPHLHWDCAHPCHICTGDGSRDASSAKPYSGPRPTGLQYNVAQPRLPRHSATQRSTLQRRRRRVVPTSR